jgi:hypothetical protein
METDKELLTLEVCLVVASIMTGAAIVAEK